jgi:hypothetical protein
MNQPTNNPPSLDTELNVNSLINPNDYSPWFRTKDGFIRFADISAIIRNREPYTCVDTPYFIVMRGGDSLPLHLEDSDLLLKKLGLKASGEILSPE